MDTSTSLSKLPHRRAAADQSGKTKGCALTLNKLTLATVFIAVVGFAGTAFAAAPLDRVAYQAPVEASTTR